MPFRPPVPPIPETELPVRPYLRAIRTNALTIFPQEAYRSAQTTRTFLGRKTVLLNTPEAIHHVLVAQPERYRRSRASIRVLRPIIGDGLLLSEGEAWKLQRRTIAPALAPRVMPTLVPHILACTDQVVARLVATAGQPVDLLATMQNLALDIAGRSMFSLEMDQYGAAMRGMLTEFAERHARTRFLDMLLPSSIPSPADFARFRFKRRWMALIESILAARLAIPQPETPRDLLDLLRAARAPETGAGFTPAELRDQVSTMILAGHETTAAALFWAVLTLAQAPQDQAWLAEEASNAVLDASLLIRTHAVVNETLRLFPPAFILLREAIGPDRIGDQDLPARSVAMISPWVLHRHDMLWDDPAAFRPARFMPDQPPPDRFAFMPFGAGPRICVGAQFAMTEAVLVLASLIGRFVVSRVDTRPILPVGIVTTQPDYPAEVRFMVRQGIT